MSIQNPARKGPKRVWKGYRNLRVPLELFEDVKRYLEEIKMAYLGEDEERVMEFRKRVSTTLSPEDKELLNQIPALRQEINRLKEELQTPNVLSNPLSNYSRLTSKEKIKQFLFEHSNQRFTTIEIAQQLSMPDATCRQASRELSQEDNTIVQISGRPNRYFHSNINEEN